LTQHLQVAEGDALAGLQGYFEHAVAEFEQTQFKGGCLLGNLMGEIGDTSDLCQKSLQSALTRYRDLLQTGLAKAQQQGTVRSDKSALDMADLLVNAWQGALLRMKIEKSSAPLKQCYQELLGDFFKV
jgi:TetR/AcrR family transcriptional repressor of nem operon